MKEEGRKSREIRIKSKKWEMEEKGRKGIKEKK